MKLIMKRINLAVAILFVLLISVGFVSAITGVVGNARMVLYPEVNGWTNTVIEKSILVKNVNDVPINVTLQIDEEGQKFLELIDNSFILEPHTEKKAQFLVKVKKEGTYQSKINIFFSSTDENQKTGVALSSEIIVIAKKNQEDRSNVPNEEDASGNGDGSTETTTTGDVVADGSEGQKRSALKWGLLIGSVVVLLAILIVLITFLSKKGGKRGKKVNGRRKK